MAHNLFAPCLLKLVAIGGLKDKSVSPLAHESSVLSGQFSRCANVVRSLLLTPFALKYSDQTVNEWREHKWEAVAIAILIPFCYVLVLTAMRRGDWVQRLRWFWA